MVSFLPRVFMKEDFLALRVNASGVCGQRGGGGGAGGVGRHQKCMFSLSQQFLEPWASLTFSSECSPSRDLGMTPGGIFFFFFFNVVAYLCVQPLESLLQNGQEKRPGKMQMSSRNMF